MANRRAKGEGSVYKDSNGYWNAQIQVGRSPDGKIKYKKFRSKKQGVVIEKMNNYKLGIGTASVTTIEQATVESLLTSYIEIVKKISVRATTYDGAMVQKNQVVSHIGEYYVKDLTSEIIQINLINKMCGEGYAFSTIHKAYILLNECLNYAVEKDYIVKNPCKAVRLPNKDGFTKKEIRFLTDDEIVAFKNQAVATMKTINAPKYVYGNILCLVIYTGLRVGELSALKWSDINFERRNMSINKSIVVNYDYSTTPKKRILVLQNTTKNGKSRIVPLNDKAVAILEQQKKLYGGSDNCFIVNGTEDLPDKTVIASSYSKIAKAAGISNPAGVHSLRHTFASLAIRKGVDIKVVSEILGHASVAFTYNTYVHIIEEQKAQALDLLNDI